MTRNGKLILDIINHSNDHLTAEQIFIIVSVRDKYW